MADTIHDKVQHVLRAPDNDRGHTCHWPGCTVHCKPAFFSCRRHWFTWPQHIRSAIWREYEKGQEQSKTPSPAYMQAVTAAITWAENYERAQRAPDPAQGALPL